MADDGMTPETFDVVIIGAGPAGCAAAIELGNRGLNAVVLERGLPGKDKPCGDCFLYSAIAVLEEYGVNTRELSKDVTFRSVSLYNDSKLVWEFKSGEDLARVMPRKMVDQQLRDIVARKATIWYDCCVLDIELESDDRWKISYRKEGEGCIYAKGVVIATGALNKLSKKWKVCGQPQDSAAVSAYVDLGNAESLLFQFTDLCKPGYGWIFPCAGGKANIGVCALAESQVQLKKAASGFLHKWNINEDPDCQ
jgi:flavin-dependent dehydrogenase